MNLSKNSDIETHHMEWLPGVVMVAEGQYSTHDYSQMDKGLVFEKNIGDEGIWYACSQGQDQNLRDIKHLSFCFSI